MRRPQATILERNPPSRPGMTIGTLAKASTCTGFRKPAESLRKVGLGQIKRADPFISIDNYKLCLYECQCANMLTRRARQE